MAAAKPVAAMKSVSAARPVPEHKQLVAGKVTAARVTSRDSTCPTQLQPPAKPGAAVKSVATVPERKQAFVAKVTTSRVPACPVLSAVPDPPPPPAQPLRPAEPVSVAKAKRAAKTALSAKPAAAAKPKPLASKARCEMQGEQRKREELSTHVLQKGSEDLT